MQNSTKKILFGITVILGVGGLLLLPCYYSTVITNGIDSFKTHALLYGNHHQSEEINSSLVFESLIEMI